MALSETSDEKLFKGDGASIFEMAQQREIDAAMRKIRQALGVKWEPLRKDQELLASGLKSAWENAGNEEWETFRFSTVSQEDATSIIAAEKAAASKKKSRVQASAQVLEVLRNTTGRG